MLVGLSQQRILCVGPARAISEEPWCFSLYIKCRFVARFCIICKSHHHGSSWMAYVVVRA